MRVRPDIVKLDRALIRDIHTDPARMALVESFVRFARDVGATVCAEGIETLEELAVIADLDVQWGQGYALARPARALGRGLHRAPPSSAARRSPRPSARCRPSATRSAPATAAWSTSAHGSPARAPATTSRARSP